MTRLILASRSEHRRQLLVEAGYEVEQVAASVEEPDLTQFSDLQEGLLQVAAFKARAVARAGAAGLVFAADTIGFVGGQVFGKPVDRADARRMLEAISGTEHEVMTGWCLLRTRDDVYIGGVERTKLTMRRWSDEEMARYLDEGKWREKSGAYGLEWPHDPFVTHIEGSPSNVIGVPLERLRSVLEDFALQG